MRSREQIRPVKRAVADALFSFDGVVGVDINYVETADHRTEQLGIVVHVRRKGHFPHGQTLPRAIEGIRVDVVEGFVNPGDDRALTEGARAWHQIPDLRPYRPLKGGASLCNAAAGGWGTLGVVFRRAGDPPHTHHLLTCAHVVGGCGAEVAQPGRPAGTPDEGKHVAQVTESILGIPTQGGRAVDCAIARIERTTAALPDHVRDLDPLSFSRDEAALGEVLKVGATSGLTFGVVDSIDFDLLVPYPDPARPKLRFQDQMLIRPSHAQAEFALPGDSGSVVVDYRRRIVGLLFARLKRGKRGAMGVAHPIADVLAALAIDPA